ncbi:MAG: glycosyltransferase family 39 protein, partial [Rhodospirillaceae bacterium]|nr:glycosyltransferase family 39 protein [Rhodospirillaceae bacterium]
MSLAAAWSLRPRRAGAWLLLAFCLALYLPGLVSLPPTDRDEARFAQASRQMLESGDFLDIRFQDEARYKKPVGIYWLQAASAALTRAADRIWPYRLPSLLGAIAAVFLTAHIGARLFDGPTGLVGGALLAATALLAMEARLATTDAVLLATVCLAELGLAEVYLAARRGDAARRGPVLAFWAAVGAGVLVKGPIPLLVVGGTALALCLADRDFAWLRGLRFRLGLPLAAAIVLPWLAAIAWISDGAFFRASLGRDLLAKVVAGQESHGLPPGSYLAMFPLCFWPASLLAVLAAPWAWRNRRDDAVRFCLAWALPTWLVFEAVPTKLPHYVLPAYPALALLTARALPLLRDGSARWPGRLFNAGAPLWLLLSAGLAAAGPALLWWLDGRLDAAAVAGAVAVVACAAGGLWLLRRRPAPALAALAGAALLAYGTGFGLVLPQAGPLWVSREVAAAVRAAAPACPRPAVAAVGYAEPSLVFLVGTRTRLVDEAGAARLLAEDPCAVAVVSDVAEEGFRSALARLNAPAESVAEVAGLNYSKGQRVRLTVYRAPARTA